MLRTDAGVMELAWTLKTGRPPREFDAYAPRHLAALLLHQQEMREVLAQAEAGDDDEWSWINQEPKPGPPRRGKVRWEDRIETDDPLAAKWEEQIARGEVPDFDAPVPRRRR